MVMYGERRGSNLLSAGEVGYLCVCACGLCDEEKGEGISGDEVVGWLPCQDSTLWS